MCQYQGKDLYTAVTSALSGGMDKTPCVFCLYGNPLVLLTDCSTILQEHQVKVVAVRPVIYTYQLCDFDFSFEKMVYIIYIYIFLYIYNYIYSDL